MLLTVDSHFSTSSDPPPSYTTYPEEGGVVSSYSNWLSYSSRELLPPSPSPKTLPDKDSHAPSTLGGKPVHIDFIDRRSDIIMKHDKVLMHNVHRCTWRFGSWCQLVMFKMSRTPSRHFYFVLLPYVQPLTGESSFFLFVTIIF